MRSFVRRVLLFGSVFMAALCVLIYLTHSHPDSYISAIHIKHENFARSPSPRLLLVGGSNLAFGIQSEMLEEKLPFSPVNLGLQAAFGIDFYLADALPLVAPGDVVILSLEYDALEPFGGSRMLWEGLIQRPAVLKNMHYTWLSDAGFGFFGHVTKRGLRSILRRDRIESRGIYKIESFNRYGDIVEPRTHDPDRKISFPPVLTGDYEEGLARLTEFVDTCEKRGAKVFFIFPPVLDSWFQENRAMFEQYVATMSRKFGSRILSELNDIPLEKTEFYDTVYHLTSEAAERRTLQIVSRIRRVGIDGRKS